MTGHRRALVDYFVYSRDVPGVSAQLDALAEAHWSYMDRFADRLVARGPTLTDDGETHTGSIHIVTVPDAGAARHFADDEPFHSAGLYADTAVSRYVNLLERSMWDRPPVPDLERTTFLRAAWPAIAADARTVRAARETAVAGSDPWVFLGLLVSEDASPLRRHGSSRRPGRRTRGARATRGPRVAAAGRRADGGPTLAARRSAPRLDRRPVLTTPVEAAAVGYSRAMFRVACVALLLACSSPTTPPAKPPIVTPEPTPHVAQAPTAGQQFAVWLATFNDGKREDLEAMRTKLLTAELAKQLTPIDGLLGFREDVGGFEVKKTEESTPTRYVALVKERAGDNIVRMVIEIEAGPPHRIKQFDVDFVPMPAEFRPPRLTEAAALDALRAELDRVAAKDNFSGAVAIGKHGVSIFAQAYGLADRDRKVANTPDTRFRIGSMNKMFTAVATLQLVQAKKLALDDTVQASQDYPNKDLASKVTIHHLLTHTGGTGDIFGPDYDKKRLELRTLEDYVKLYGDRAPEYAPGERFGYSNYGFLLLGVITARVTRDVLRPRPDERVQATGMTSTASPFEDQPARAARSRTRSWRRRSAGGLDQRRRHAAGPRDARRAAATRPSRPPEVRERADQAQVARCQAHRAALDREDR